MYVCKRLTVTRGYKYPTALSPADVIVAEGQTQDKTGICHQRRGTSDECLDGTCPQNATPLLPSIPRRAGSNAKAS